MTISDEGRARLVKASRAVENARGRLGAALGEQDQAIITAYAEGTTSMREIAEAVGISHQRVAQVIGEYGTDAEKDKAADEIVGHS